MGMSQEDCEPSPTNVTPTPTPTPTPPRPTEVQEELDECDEVFPDGIMAPPERVDAARWRETGRGGKISSDSYLVGLSRVVISDNTVLKRHVMLRADLCNISLGNYVILKEGCLVVPSWRMVNGKVAYLATHIKDYVVIGADSTIEATSIAPCVKIGRKVSIGQRCVIRSCVVVDDNTVVPPGTVLPPFTRWAGDPAILVGRLHEGAQHDIKLHCKMEYAKVMVEKAEETT